MFGYKDYYFRFGFEFVEKWEIGIYYEVLSEYFMGLELILGVLLEVKGIVEYLVFFS